MVDAAAACPDPKQLASNDKKTRDRACKALATYLSGGQATETPLDDSDEPSEAPLDARFADKEMLVLHKGLFYCMWMSDKPLVQQALCNSLSNLVLDVRASTPGRRARVKACMAFLRGFWTTITREWSGVDRLRTDKYYLLMRRFVTVTFTLLIREQWDAEAIAQLNALLIGPGGPFNVQDPKTPLSIFSHIAEIYLSSLSAAIAASSSSSSPIPPVPLLSLLSPIIHALCYAPAKNVYFVGQANAAMPLISACEAATESAEAKPPPSKKKRTAIDAEVARAFEPFDALLAAPMALSADSEGEVVSPKGVKQAVLRAFFEAAARTETPDANRRRIYTLCQEHSDEAL